MERRGGGGGEREMWAGNTNYPKNKNKDNKKRCHLSWNHIWLDSINNLQVSVSGIHQPQQQHCQLLQQRCQLAVCTEFTEAVYTQLDTAKLSVVEQSNTIQFFGFVPLTRTALLTILFLDTLIRSLNVPPQMMQWPPFAIFARHCKRICRPHICWIGAWILNVLTTHVLHL